MGKNSTTIILVAAIVAVLAVSSKLLGHGIDHLTALAFESIKVRVGELLKL